MFGGGGGGLNPRKMEQMMEQMGIDVEDIDAEEVIIRTDEHDLVFSDAEVTKMDARGQETYQIIGSPEEVESAAVWLAYVHPHTESWRWWDRRRG